MGTQLLEKEREYHELNKQLELRTKELLSEVDNVIKLKHSVLSLNEKPNFPARSVEAEPRKKCAKPVKNAPETIEPEELAELGLPEDVNAMGSKGMVRFLKAKMKKTLIDNERILKDYKTKCDEMKNIQKENQTLLDDKEKWMQTALVGKNQLTKLENQVHALNSKLQTKDGEIASVQKEVEQLQKELRCCKLNASGAETKINRLTEELEKAKAALKTMKHEEKELRENHRKEIAELTGAIKKIEKHKNELLNGFKKQMLLIENLKKQKAHIGALKLTEKTEGDFKNFLDWKSED